MKNLTSRSRMRGQSLAEMAVVIPILFFLLMGGFDASVMIADKITAGYAVRQGVRLAAEEMRCDLRLLDEAVALFHCAVVRDAPP